jgi:16S rRNA (cytosine967-C5)-methyltransferase
MNPTSLTGHILELIRCIEGSTHPPDNIVKDFFRSRKYLGSHDRRTIANAIFGLLRNRRYVETLLDRFIKNHPGADILSDPQLISLPLLVCYSELIDTSVKIPSTFWATHFPKISIDQYTEWIKQNSSLNFLDNDDVQKLGVRYSFPDWMVSLWNVRWGTETEELLRTLNIPAPTTLRVNVLRTDRAECQRRLKEEGTETEFTQLSTAGLIATKRFNSEASQSYKDGWFEIQDEGSQLISLLIEPKPGNFVVDACAGAGGKSIHLAELMNNEGEVVSLDIDRRRLNNLLKRAKRAQIKIIKAGFAEDFTKEYLTGKADIVLIDAPCSGSGTIRRNPGLKWSITPSLVKHYSELQNGIIESSALYLKTKGKLVYATCSLFTDENESVVNKFLDKNPGYSIISIKDGLTKYGIKEHSSLYATHKSHVTLLPHIHHTDGYFIAILKKDY